MRPEYSGLCNNASKYGARGKMTAVFYRVLMRQILLLILVVVLVGCGVQRLRAGKASAWETISNGVEMRTLSVRSDTTLSGKVNVIALRTTPSRVRVVSGATLDAPQWRRRHNAIAATNGGFFDKSGRSLGLRVATGKKLGSLRSANWGVFYITRRGQKYRANVRHTKDFAERYSKLRNVYQAVQCGPRLVVDGQTTDLKPQLARRIGIGVQRDGRVIIALSDGALPLQDWASLWARSNGLNCLNALNLDGGGSTQLSLKTAKKSYEIGGAWPVPDAIIIQ